MKVRKVVVDEGGIGKERMRRVVCRRMLRLGVGERRKKDRMKHSRWRRRRRQERSRKVGKPQIEEEKTKCRLRCQGRLKIIHPLPASTVLFLFRPI